MTDFADYWDAEAKIQMRRPLNVSEQAELDARRLAALQPVIPEFVPKLNARLVLIGAGYWDDVVSFITAQGPIALAFLQYAQTMRRDNVLVNAWAAARGKSGELDGLFIAAGNLNPDAIHG